MAPLEDLSWIRKSSIVILGLAALFSLYLAMFELTVGLVIGGLISILNFHLIERIITLAFKAEVSQAGMAGRIVLKFLGLAVLVSTVLVLVPIDAVGFVAGLSVIFISMGLGGVFQLLKKSPEHSESSDA